MLLIFYAHWLLTAQPTGLPGILASALAVFLFALLGLRFIPQWMRAWSTAPWEPIRPLEGRRTSRPRNLHPTLSILLALALYRLLLLALAYALQMGGEGYTGGIFDTLGVWNRLGSDSRHYLNIAENWYTNTGDDRLLIVFMPLYPILVRLFNFIFQDYLASGLFVSNLCCVLSGLLFYELALLDHDIPTARRQLKYLCILPAAFLFSAPLSDALFLTLTLACVYFMRKRRWVFSAIFGFFAAFTRAPGVLLFAPLCFELVGEILRQRQEKRGDRRWALRQAGSALSLLLVPCGLLLYLYVNYSVTGDPFRFLYYQSMHWRQNLGWFFATVNTQTVNLIENLGAAGNIRLALGLWLPNLAYIFASLGLMIKAQRKLRASYVAYFIAYFAVCIGATWLLSGPRYLTACFPLAMALGSLTEKRWADRLATLLCLALLVVYMAAWVRQWYVY
ncbi:MAG: hypothetical protein Q4C13_05420 [Clostridia bacterium]|nr:hypothetical protein [Clostridia bacterium]